EGRAGVGLAPGCDVTVARDPARRQRRVGALQAGDEGRERLVLALVVGRIVRALEFNADREVVAAAAAAPLRAPRVPGAKPERHVLHEAAVAVDQHVRRYAKVLDRLKIRM